jgi:hypothetical protein
MAQNRSQPQPTRTSPTVTPVKGIELIQRQIEAGNALLRGFIDEAAYESWENTTSSYLLLIRLFQQRPRYWLALRNWHNIWLSRSDKLKQPDKHKLSSLAYDSWESLRNDLDNLMVFDTRRACLR